MRITHSVDITYSTCSVLVAGCAAAAATQATEEVAEDDARSQTTAVSEHSQSPGAEDTGTSQGWSHADTLLLITTYKSKKAKFADPTRKKKEVWTEIATTMNEFKNSSNFNADKCSKKWNNLELRYKAIRDKKRKTGRGRGKPWLYYEKIDEIIGTSASAAPVSASCSTGHEPAATLERPLVAPDSDSSGDEEQARVASTSIRSPNQQQAGTSRKRKRNEAPIWLETVMEKLDEKQSKRHEKLEEMMKKQEEAIKERTKIMTEMKDIFKAWVDKQQ